MSLHGIPYDLSGDTIHTALKHYIFPVLDTLLHEYQPTPWILLVTKGPLKIRLLENLFWQWTFFSHLIIAIEHFWQLPFSWPRSRRPLKRIGKVKSNKLWFLIKFFFICFFHILFFSFLGNRSLVLFLKTSGFSHKEGSVTANLLFGFLFIITSESTKENCSNIHLCNFYLQLV